MRSVCLHLFLQNNQTRTTQLICSDPFCQEEHHTLETRALHERRKRHCRGQQLRSTANKTAIFKTFLSPTVHSRLWFLRCSLHQLLCQFLVILFVSGELFLIVEVGEQNIQRNSVILQMRLETISFTTTAENMQFPRIIPQSGARAFCCEKETQTHLVQTVPTRWHRALICGPLSCVLLFA